MVVCDTLQDAFASSFHLNRRRRCSIVRSFFSIIRTLGHLILPISIRCFDEHICIFYCFVMEYNLPGRIEIIEFKF